jgi:DNA-binding beta-propeller fold protein YncE
MSGTPDTTPTHYTSRVILSRVGRPDDLAFDPQGHLVFGDYYNGTVSRVNANGSVTVLVSGVAGPEGIVFLPDGTMIIAEQRTNRILSLDPGANSLTVLRTLPGTPAGPPCKDGVDGIAFDPLTKTLIVPDSPTGNVYRMSLDGQKLTLLASGIPRPVGAAVDTYGTVYIADECGGSLWSIAANGKTTRIRGFGKLDDVALDSHGNILVIDLLPSIHALIRIRHSTGKRETLASRGFIEPQGLAIDKNDDIFVSDDYANIIVEYKPA